ncbi:MAG: nucleoside deaminase [Cyclobacteriaceae bacterium]|nr:nucleoside deaminase [Cyclobacteriaceae bacterium]
MAYSFGSDEYFMNEAFKQAEIAFEEGEVPVGAVVVCNNKIVAKAHNQTERLNDSTAHAEILALTSAFNYLGAKYLPDCTLFVTLEPCTMCAGALNWSQIGKVVYGATDPKRGYKRLVTKKEQVLHPKTEIITGVLEKQCGDLVSAFFKKLR